ALDDRVGQTYAFVPANEEIEEAHFPYEHEDGYRAGSWSTGPMAIPATPS
ncbi:MAG: hypothetical protein HUU25_07800, partial [Candidatus Sumerlaeia bacterium]|nr:hypothetical protein [Candidatus Sumerlaeia bacterium]